MNSFLLQNGMLVDGKGLPPPNGGLPLLNNRLQTMSKTADGQQLKNIHSSIKSTRMKPLTQKLSTNPRNGSRVEAETEWNQLGVASAFKQTSLSVKAKQRTYSEKREYAGVTGPSTRSQYVPFGKPQSRCESGRFDRRRGPRPPQVPGSSHSKKHIANASANVGSKGKEFCLNGHQILGGQAVTSVFDS